MMRERLAVKQQGTTQLTYRMLSQASNGGVFESDIVAPEEFFEHLRSKEFPPVKNLMLAILEDSVHLYQKYYAVTHPKGRAIFNEERAWIDSRDTTWIFSFEVICEAVGIDANWLRKGLATWREGHIATKRLRRTPPAHKHISVPAHDPTA
jgi:hypothetical protein